MGVSQDSLALRAHGSESDPDQNHCLRPGDGHGEPCRCAAHYHWPDRALHGREYIGRVFAITVLGGMGSIGGTLVAALILGVAESLTSTFSSPSWALAVSFGILY